MNETIDHLSKFNEIKTFDPIVKVKKGIINISPFYFNYPFVKNFIGIFIFIYILVKQNDSILNLICYISIGMFFILIITVLKYYNTIIIDIKEKKLIIKPNIFYSLIIKKEILKFEDIKKGYTVSNFNSTGFWGANRRYYIILLLKNKKEIKIVGSNKHEIASLISENISQIL